RVRRVVTEVEHGAEFVGHESGAFKSTADFGRTKDGLKVSESMVLSLRKTVLLPPQGMPDLEVSDLCCGCPSGCFLGHGKPASVMNFAIGAFSEKIFLGHEIQAK